LFNYYSWTSIKLTDDSFYWLDSVISWEDTSFLLQTNIYFVFNLVNSTFLSTFMATKSFYFFSFLDYFFLNTLTVWGNFFLFCFFFDFYFNNFNFNTTDWLYKLTLNPELFLFFNFKNQVGLDTIFNFNVHSTYDFFAFNFFHNYLNTLVFLKWFGFFVLLIILFCQALRFFKYGQFLGFFLYKVYFFLTSLAFENRLQLDLTLVFTFFVFFVWFIVLMTYDDVYVEIIELFHNYLIVLMLTIILMLLVKYSTHYFSFLEASVIDGRSVLFFSKQFVRDVSNTFALFLRFFLLLFRLNIYDGLDDFLDSYFIFFVDFDEDSYFDENFFFIDLTFLSDNNEDVIFYSLNEFDWFEDLYSKYFIIWGKFFMFWFFILEEAFRVTLALYIFYLIIFEVHSVNVSYNETNFFSSKR